MKTILFMLVAFTELTSTFSGLLLISNPDGGIMSLSTSVLDGTPFHNFLVPGLILTVMVGGVNLLAVFYNLQRHANRYTWAIAGGIMISGWIIIQMLLIHAANGLHFLYLGIGILTILLAYQLKGKWAV